MTHDERRQDARRIDFESEVQIDFPDLGEFIREYSANMSTGGMFIKTMLPFKPGHEFRFQFNAGDELPMISGRAVVVWRREREVSPRAVAGMGVRFLELDGNSETLIEKIVHCNVDSAGGSPFELTEVPQIKM